VPLKSTSQLLTKKLKLVGLAYLLEDA